MFDVIACDHPPDSRLKACEAEYAYVDCYSRVLGRSVALSEFIRAFYTSAPFKLERVILSLALGRPSSDDEVDLLGRGQADTFAVWKVEHRSGNQILLGDINGRTKSWLMAEPSGSELRATTRLYLGSAITPGSHPDLGKSQLGASFKSLLWFHKIYSRVLLAAAGRKLERVNYEK